MKTCIQALQEQLSGELLEVKDERIVIELMRQYIALQEQEKKRDGISHPAQIL